MAKIAILVLNYNGRKHLAGFLDAAVFLQHEPTADVVVIDNASCDGSLRFVEEKYPWVRCIRNDGNYGWGEGYNKGIEALEATGAKYTHFMFINNDVFPDEVWYQRLLQGVTSASPEVGEIGCRAVFAAPFMTEDLFAASQGASSLKWRLVSESDHDLLTVRHEGAVRRIHARAAAGARRLPGHLARHLTPAEHGTDSYYALIVENTGGKPVELELSSHLRVARQVDVSDTFGLAVVRTSPERAPSRLTVPPHRRVMVVRLVETADPKRHLIQNSGIGINGRFEGFDMHAYEDQSVAQHTVMAGICGVCKTVTAEAFHRVGGFDRHYFMYYEDLDFSLRVKAKGYKTLLIQDAIIRHVHAGSSQSRSMFFERQVTWSRYYFQYLHAGLGRRLKTWLSFRVRSLLELRRDTHWMASPHAIAVQKFLSLSGGRSYVLGPKRSEA